MFEMLTRTLAKRYRNNFAAFLSVDAQTNTECNMNNNRVNNN